jgi:hypothetical protein
MSFGCRLAATLDDGSVEQVAVEMARGKWAGERLTQDEVVAKFRSCAAAGGVDPDRAEACRALIERLVELEDIAVFAAALHDAAVA